MLLVSFVAGILTVLAPCVLPILPVIIGGSVIHGSKSRPRVIIFSFAFSILLFTLLLKYIVEQFGWYPEDLKQIAAWILLVFGVFLLFPQWRVKLMQVSRLESVTQTATEKTGSGLKGDILLGFIL
ncbi:MAG: hypothetical protein H6765_01550 [Candidatus Peribacteria bacterium]|nr:MAG: hypothetical protein H6765_01550 [Candidatus Peribacteria bacterium]